MIWWPSNTSAWKRQRKLSPSGGNAYRDNPCAPYPQGGYETTAVASSVVPQGEQVLTAVMKKLLDVESDAGE